MMVLQTHHVILITDLYSAPFQGGDSDLVRELG